MLNAANEVAVAAFLSDNRIKFLEIAAITEQVLDIASRQKTQSVLTTLEEAIAADAEARRLADEAVTARRCGMKIVE